MTKKTLLFSLMILSSNLIIGQALFNDTFNEYIDFADFEVQNDILLHRWSSIHTEPAYDFNRNGVLDSSEYIKETVIETNFGRDDNSSIRFELKKLDQAIVNGIIADFQNDLISESEYNLLFTKFSHNEVNTYIGHHSYTYSPNEEYWLEYSTYIDNSYEFESGNSTETIINNTNIELENIDVIGQWHFENKPNAPRHPPISMQIVKDKWVMVRYPIDSPTYYQLETFVVGDADKGVWVDWKFNIKFSSSGQGKIVLWKNDQLVYSIQDINTIYQDFLFYFDIGIYKPHWSNPQIPSSTVLNNKIVYFDDVKIYQNTSLIEEDCGRQLTNENMSITCEEVPGNPEYHFRIDSANSSNHVYSFSNTINLKDYSWVDPSTEYFVKVKIDDYPENYYGTYSDLSCNIYTPQNLTIGLTRDSQNNCDKNLTSHDMSIKAELLPNNPTYHFRIDSYNSSNHVYSNSIDLSNYGWVIPGKDYFVKVKIDNYPLSKYGSYAEYPCVVKIQQLASNKSVIPTKPYDKKFKVYPSPFNDYLNINSESKIEVFDYNGRLMFESKSFESKNTINTQDYDSGVYLVKIFHMDGTTDIIRVVKN